MEKADDWLLAGIDTGGTFTDTILISKNQMKVYKIPSTPHNPLEAVYNSVNKIKFVKEVLHGTTVATNAVLERKGAKIVLITTEGFADVIEIGRQNRNNIYELYPTRPEPLVQRDMRIEVKERIYSDGSVGVNLTDQELEILYTKLIHLKFDSIAISTLFSFLNPKHENMIYDKVKDLAPVSISSQVYPEFREFERTSTTVMDAYVKPVMEEYLVNLENSLIKNKLTNHFAVMKSAFGLARGKSIAKYPVNTLFSGLAAGIKAAEFTSKLLNRKNLISLDIGGTSTDVGSIINGHNNVRQTQKIDGLPVSVPSIDVETIGAGGGSLLQIISELLQVGPESAGADPGPAAYDKGGNIPTITDVDLVFGILSTKLAGGELMMKKELADQALSNLTQQLSISKEKLVIGARKIFHENIASAIRAVSTERGHDPRKFDLLAFGGAGPLHACELADMLNIKTVIIPPLPGAWSAIGLIGSDYSYNQSIGIIKDFNLISIDKIDNLFLELLEKVNSMADLDNQNDNREINRQISMRFKGQSYDITIDYISDKIELRKEFIKHHQELYGFAAKDEDIEIVALRVVLTIPHEDPVLPVVDHKDDPNIVGYRSVLGYSEKIPIFNREDFGNGFDTDGPLIIEQLDTTTWIPREWKLNVDKNGFLIIQNCK